MDIWILLLVLLLLQSYTVVMVREIVSYVVIVQGIIKEGKSAFPSNKKTFKGGTEVESPPSVREVM